VLDQGKNFTLEAARTGSFAASTGIVRDSLRGDTLSVRLDLSPVQPGGVWQTIYYAYGKSNLEDMGQSELKSLADMLKANPELRIELSSHTDSRGSASYNKQLSQRRANQALDYLVQRGVSRKRVTAIGYGEERLHNDCKDDATCTEEQHAQNRRTEIRILPVAPAKPLGAAAKIDTKSGSKPTTPDAIPQVEGTPPAPKGSALPGVVPPPPGLPQPRMLLDTPPKDSANGGKHPAPLSGTYPQQSPPVRRTGVKLF
jgi:hypothetical protein